VETKFEKGVRRWIVPLVGCIGLVVIAAITLALTFDTAPHAERRLFGLWQTRYVVLAGFLLLLAAGCLADAISRRALLGYLSVCVSLAGGFALLELVGILGIVSWPGLLTPQTSSLATKPTPYLDVKGTSLQDTAPFWGLASEPVLCQYRTDRHGFRNDIDRADADIYMIGDSVLVAALVPFPETVTARIEATVKKRVMMIALNGKSPQEEHQYFRDANVDVKGRLVIQFISAGNDLGDSARVRHSPSREEKTPWTKHTLSEHIILALQERTQPVSGNAALRTCKISGQTYTFLWGKASFDGLEDEMPAIGTALAEFATEIRKAGGEFAVVFSPTKLAVLGPQCSFPLGSEISNYTEHIGPFRGYMQDWSNRNGIPLLDLTDPLMEAGRSGHIPWFWGDSHWNAEGHAVAASVLASWKLVKAVHGSKSD